MTAPIRPDPRGLRAFLQRLTSLQPHQPTGAETIADIGMGFVPGLGQVQAGRDFIRATREGSGLGMGLAMAGMLPIVGSMAKVSKAGVLRKLGQAAEPLSEAEMALLHPEARSAVAAFIDRISSLRDESNALWRQVDALGTQRETSQLQNLTKLGHYEPTGSMHWSDATDAAQRAAASPSLSEAQLTAAADAASRKLAQMKKDLMQVAKNGMFK